MIEDLIDIIRVNWTSPKRVDHNGYLSKNEFICELNSNTEIVYHPNFSYPLELIQLWEQIGNSKFFYDFQDHHWGLDIFDSTSSINLTIFEKHERIEDYFDGDLLIGEFIADNEYLLIRCDKSKPDFGNILITNPVYKRDDWFEIENSLESFIKKYH